MKKFIFIVFALIATTAFADTFKLYPQPNQTIDPQCNLFTSADLDFRGRAWLTLEGKIEGSCEVGVVPNTRYYKLTLRSTDCGSNLWVGTSSKSSNTVTVTDHRSRTCKDIVPAELIVVETNMYNNSVTLFSSK